MDGTEKCGPAASRDADGAPAGPQGEPRRPHGPIVERSGHAQEGQTRAIGLRPAIRRLPFGLGQQDVRLPGLLLPGALLQRLRLGGHVGIHPVIEDIERHQQAAQRQIADRRHAVRFRGGGRSSIAGGQ